MQAEIRTPHDHNTLFKDLATWTHHTVTIYRTPHFQRQFTTIINLQPQPGIYSRTKQLWTVNSRYRNEMSDASFAGHTAYTWKIRCPKTEIFLRYCRAREAKLARLHIENSTSEVNYEKWVVKMIGTSNFRQFETLSLSQSTESPLVKCFIGHRHSPGQRRWPLETGECQSQCRYQQQEIHMQRKQGQLQSRSERPRRDWSLCKAQALVTISEMTNAWCWKQDLAHHALYIESEVYALEPTIH